MIEVLVSLLIITFGLLGLAGLQARATQGELESYQRAQALILLSDMADRLTSNRYAAACYAITTNANDGTPFVGGTAASAPAACGLAVGDTDSRARANQDLTEWHELLLGSAEVGSGGSMVGAMVGARGCISVNTATPPEYTIAVAWQGTVDTVSSSNNCAKAGNLYGSDGKRRVVSTAVVIPVLN